MSQKDCVIEVMRQNGGYATLQILYSRVDCSSWKTNTPYASIRRIVQKNEEFFRIQPGLWALKEYEKEVLSKFNIVKNDVKSVHEFTHSYFQGILLEIGNMRNFTTYVPAQDRNKLFFPEKRLSDIASLDKIFDFAYTEILRKAKTVDTIWFNKRKMPFAFYEVEHTTDIKNSLNKFYELQDFRANFYIVAGKERKNQFDDCINSSIYSDIRSFIKFVDYENLIQQYENESKLKGALI